MQPLSRDLPCSILESILRLFRSIKPCGYTGQKEESGKQRDGSKKKGVYSASYWGIGPGGNGKREICYLLLLFTSCTW